jgi:hypothetical protein
MKLLSDTITAAQIMKLLSDTITAAQIIKLLAETNNSTTNHEAAL